MRLPAAPPKPVTLPSPLPFERSPNQSDRLHGLTPYLIVAHRPVGNYGPSIDWLRKPEADASAHWISEGNGTGVDVATQLVEWHRKAWACASFNSASYNLEIDDDAWDGDDLGAAFTGARMAAYICWKTGIPATWSKNPLSTPGLIRHVDLGEAGGGHSDPTEDDALWRWWVRQVARELERGGFRRTYGVGTFTKLPRRLAA
jgi:hypothetical protein